MPLGHHLEQCRLHLRGGAVDLVGEDEVRDDRAQFGIELFATLPVDPGADQVGRNEVGGELHAGERTADDLGEGLHREGLGHTGHAFEQHVAPGEDATSIRSTSRSCPTMTRLTS